MEAKSAKGSRLEELSQNISPVVDTFFYLRGPGADLLVVVCLKYPTPLTNLQKPSSYIIIIIISFTLHTLLCAVQMQEKARAQLRRASFSCCNTEAAEVCRFVVKSAPTETVTRDKRPPREYGLQSAMATVTMI